MSESKMKAMVEYPYRPGVPEYGSGMLDRTTDNVWKIRIKPDPLGPVNKIVTLVRNGEPVTSVLHPVNEGDNVQLIRDDGGFGFDYLYAIKDLHWHKNEYGQNVAKTYIPFRKPGWRVEINGDTILSVTDAELRPTPPPAPRTPLWRRMRRTLLEQACADADAIAGRLGYHRDDDCYRWDY